MAQPFVSPAYHQELQWYQNFQKVQGAKPVPLLASENDSPDDLVNQPMQTDPSTPMVDISA
ncbi:MAG TPA: hypothetical protein VHU61_03515 [Solirubrobacteraceae bacterium]|jgi:hypothetical protein|nr:hypothetical protein [Solirubrobacteraceae bacterium]